MLALILAILNSARYSNDFILFFCIKGFKDNIYAHACIKLFEYRNCALHTKPVIVKIKFQYDVKKALVYFNSLYILNNFSVSIISVKLA